jgi:hypothetical protein
MPPNGLFSTLNFKIITKSDNKEQSNLIPCTFVLTKFDVINCNVRNQEIYFIDSGFIDQKLGCFKNVLHFMHFNRIPFYPIKQVFQNTFLHLMHSTYV